MTNLAIDLGDVSTDPRTLFEKLFLFEAPFLEEKSLDKGIVADHAEFEEIFTELKKYLALAATKEQVGMISDKVDQVWHAFILFTPEYHHFCDLYFGRYLHHRPEIKSSPVPREAYWNFVRMYRTAFGPLPATWGVVMSDSGACVDEVTGADCMGCTHCMGCNMPGCSGCM